MTTFANSVIITHEVFHSGVSSSKGYNIVSSGWLNDAFKYYEGRDGHANKEVDKSLTQADTRLEQIKYLEGINAIVDYGSRSGRFKDRNPDIPMAVGERSGAVWDARGICNPEEVKARILAAGTNVMRTVVTVPREWAETLHLSTKEEWQNIIRSTWPEFVDKWDVIPRQYQDWCAFFHTDNKVNIHCHIITWDKSGYYFTGINKIPHKNIEPSKEVIRKEIFKSFSRDRSILKSYAREASMLRTKQILGIQVDHKDVIRVENLAQQAGESFSAMRPKETLNKTLIENLLAQAADNLPPSGIGRAGYHSVNFNARAAANLALIELRKDSLIAELNNSLKQSIEMGADILGKHGWAREKYIQGALQDIDRRCANIFLRKAAERNQPWIKDAAIAALRNSIISSNKVKIPNYVIHKAANELERTGSIDLKTVYWSGYQSLKDEGLNKEVQIYKSSVISYVEAQIKKPLREEQRERIQERINSDIVKNIGALVKKEALYSCLKTIRSSDSRLTRNSLFMTRAPHIPSERSSIMLSSHDRKFINQNFDHIKKDMRHQKPLNKDALDRIACNILSKPEITASVNKAVQLASLTPQVSLKDISKQEFSRRYERIQEQVIEMASREVAYDREVSLTQRAATIESFINAACQKSGEQDMVKDALLVKLGAYDKHTDQKLEAQIENRKQR